jgi:hypothetical protein
MKNGTNSLQLDQAVSDDAGSILNDSDNVPKKTPDVQSNVQDSVKQTMTF